MRSISYKEYFDKVYGCWLGKSIAGTIGAPFEGRKELFHYEYDPRSIEEMLPNDDLDIQIIWLEVLEQKGIYFTSDDLAKAFYDKYPLCPGEYAYFQKNYIRGIMPPVSGKFNNRYYIDGMGCPIRSEIWACVAAGNMELASDFAKLDGVLDHGDNSVEGEIFLAALEAELFFENDIMAAIDKALKLLNPKGKMYQSLTDVIRWCERYQDMKKVRSLILEHWGHADCTNLYQNMGISLLALFLGKGDFLKTTMLALNCGYDTDCTCATVGALLGIMCGADALLAQGFTDSGYILDAKVERRSNTLRDLAEDTCFAGLTMAKYRNREIAIIDAPEYSELPHERNLPVIEMKVDYQGIPSMGPDEVRTMRLVMRSHSDAAVCGTLFCEAPEGWEIGVAPTFAVEAHGELSVPFTVSTYACTERFNEDNHFTFCADVSAEKISYSFGIAGAAVWKVYGPFWSNHSSIPPIPYWEKYGEYFDHVDDLRAYHLNTFADIDTAYVDEADFENIEKNESDTCSMIPKRVSLYEDCFSISDFITYQGSCVVYMVRELFSDEERTAVINVGQSAPFRLWLNGEFVCGSDDCNWWIAENVHSEPVKIHKGRNVLVLKAAKVGENCKFSLIFNDGLFTHQHYNYASLIDRK